MLTRRQYLILQYYIEKQGNYISSDEIANHFDISIRTTKSDLKAIKMFCEKFQSFILETLPSKGTRLLVLNDKKFRTDAQKFLLNIHQFQVDDGSTRIQKLLKILLESKGYISKYTLSESLFVSESTLYHALQEVKRILKNYNLTLSHKTNIGYCVEGKEINKRMCIAKHEMGEKSDGPLGVSHDLYKVYEVVADTFFKYKYQINEQALQNITSHIVLTIRRVKNGHLMIEPFAHDLGECIELTIADEILNKFLLSFRISKECYDNEVRLLAQNILGKIDYSRNEKLQKEVNDFLNDSFVFIKHKFGVNFEPVDNLKLLLALHLVPLIYRIKSGTQLINVMSSEIRQSFPLAYDIALYFSILMNDHFHLQISQDEISFLGLYFNYGLENSQLGQTAKKILIITSLRKSETVLLRHKILTWFPNQISEIVFISEVDDSIEFDDYDAVFSTDKNSEKYKGGITMISIFPDEKDFEKINLAINGFYEQSSITSKFVEECFFYGTVKDKDEVLRIVCENAAKRYRLGNEFKSVIEAREQISSTYFGNGIAIPHPLSPFSEDTFVSMAVLKKPIQWDATHTVSIVMLVSIEKNNPKAFQFWYYISTLVRNEELFASFYKKPTYQNFIKTLSLSLKNDFE